MIKETKYIVLLEVTKFFIENHKEVTFICSEIDDEKTEPEAWRQGAKKFTNAQMHFWRETDRKIVNHAVWTLAGGNALQKAGKRVCSVTK